VQYAATAYVEMLSSREVKFSMASVGEPEKNGYAERLMRTIKEEVNLSDYEDFCDALRGLGRFRRFRVQPQGRTSEIPSRGFRLQQSYEVERSAEDQSGGPGIKP